jgi:PAS domain S-box-containing protein
MRELSFVADAAPVYLAHLDATERILFANATFSNRFGRTPGEFVGRHAMDIVGAAAYAVLSPHIRRALAGETVEVVLNAPLLGLGPRDLMCLCVPERATDGTVIGFVAAVTDITRARTIERQLHDSERRFAVLAEFVPVIVWSMRPDGSNEWVNRAWYDYTGLPSDRAVDDMWATLLHPDDVQRAKDAWARASASPAPMEMQYRLRRADGTYRWFVGRIAPQFDADGNVTQWFGTAADIQDAKETERLLREQQRLLRDADRRKDEFIATLAHELRNPLAPIRSAAAVLRLPEADAPARDRAAAVIQRQVATMALLLDDLLDVSRITRGTLKLHRQRVALADVVDSAVEIARPPMEQRGHRLTIERPDPDVELDVDPLRLSQVIANLLTNAAKYTDPGGAVRVVATVEGDVLRVAVHDTGIGLAPESQREIFRMFSQVRSSLDRSEGGLGIGLALVKGLVELHGGTIEAHSEGLGRGSEFRVTVPRVVTRELPRGVPAETRRAGASTPRRVLVADDSRDGAETLAMLLRLDGHEVRVTHDGLEALKLLREYKPDVALLDIGMPSMNGYEIVGAVRGEPWRRRATLVAITGWGQDEDKRRAKAAGFDVHLTKPVEPELLEQVFRRTRETDSLARVN